MIIFYLAIGRLSAVAQIACSAQSEPRISYPVRCPAWNIERQTVVARRYIDAIENVLERSAPTAIGVEVDPGIQLRSARCVLHVDRHASTELADHHCPEGHAVLVVGHAVRVVTVGRHRRLAVGFAVAIRTQPRARGDVDGSVVDQQRRVRRWRVAQILGHVRHGDGKRLFVRAAVAVVGLDPDAVATLRFAIENCGRAEFVVDDGERRVVRIGSGRDEAVGMRVARVGISCRERADRRAEGLVLGHAA